MKSISHLCFIAFMFLSGCLAPPDEHDLDAEEVTVETVEVPAALQAAPVEQSTATTCTTQFGRCRFISCGGLTQSQTMSTVCCTNGICTVRTVTVCGCFNPTSL